MKPVVSLLFIIVLVLSTSTESLADLPGPKTPKKDNKILNSTLEIVPDAKATNARLLIRQSDLNQLKAALEESAANQSVAASIFNNAPRTIIAGLLICLSISFAGILLVRSIRTAGVSRGHKTASIILLVVTTLGAAAIVSRGNAGPNRVLDGGTYQQHSQTGNQRPEPSPSRSLPTITTPTQQ